MISRKMSKPLSRPNSENAGLIPVFKRREPKPYWRKDWLQREYSKGRSAAEIAKEFGCIENNVLYFLAKHGIPRRSMSEIRKRKKWGLHGEANGMFGRCGCRNPRWIDGSSPERNRMYARSFWKDLIRAIYERDDYKCARCGAPHSGKNRLHAHHVKPWAGNPNARFDLRNIITLCAACHTWVHSKRNVAREYLSFG